MNGKLIGYIRANTTELKTEFQLEGLAELDKIFIDNVSGKSVERPALKQLIGYVQDGDTIIVHNIDRLASRNFLDDLKTLLRKLKPKKVKIEFIKEPHEFKRDYSSKSNLFLSLMGVIADFELSQTRKRQFEAIALPKKQVNN